ncbi:MAG: hypothetical protein EOO61_09495 [Hymenobacter sp.]|nr:MAG: hypothetical protein EOO61_09495 [Hymenobacter sp.]
MRKLFLNTRAIPIFALLTFLWSCKKVELESGIQSKEKFDIQQVVGWLESKKISDKSERNLKINELINGINQEGLWMERINEQESLIVIPLNETYTPQNDIKAEHINYLLILASNDLKIKQASVVQFAPKDESINSLPKNTFSKIFTNQNITLEGQLFVFSITGRYKYDLTFVNGKRSKLREIARFENSKGADGFNYRTNQQCWTFYTVITTWYADGSHDSETYNNGTFCYACGEINPIGQTVQCTEINNDDGNIHTIQIASSVVKHVFPSAIAKLVYWGNNSSADISQRYVSLLCIPIPGFS